MVEENVGKKGMMLGKFGKRKKVGRGAI